MEVYKRTAKHLYCTIIILVIKITSSSNFTVHSLLVRKRQYKAKFLIM